MPRPSQWVWREVNLSLPPESQLSQPAGTPTAMESAKAQSRNTHPFTESFSSKHRLGMKNCPIHKVPLVTSCILYQSQKTC